MTFKYTIEVRNGYRPVGEADDKNIIEFGIEAKCRAEADRMVTALLAEDNVLAVAVV